MDEQDSYTWWDKKKSRSRLAGTVTDGKYKIQFAYGPRIEIVSEFVIINIFHF